MLSCCKEIVYVAVTAAPVAARAGYYAIGAHVIRGVAETAATSAARANNHFCDSCAWSRHGGAYSSWSWGGCLVVLGAMKRVKVCS